MIHLHLRPWACLFALHVGVAYVPAAEETTPKSRDFLFTYQTTITGLTPGQSARIWLPVPASTPEQQATIEKQVMPGKPTVGTESKYGNRILYVEGKASQEGTISASVVYRIKRMEVKADQSNKSPIKEDIELFLKPDAKVPLGGKPLMLIASLELPRDQLKMGRVFYDVVNTHMRYSKDGIGWGMGDAVWACDSKFGNCSDFHSLFISLARSHQIPAKFEMGFPLPEKRGQGEIGGYHCWAWFKPEGKSWLPVDISEANKNPKMKDYYFGNLTEDRVAFTTGRDLTLTPKQDGPALNFFVYPYVEVDGKPYPADKVQRKFGYEDVPAARK